MPMNPQAEYDAFIRWLATNPHKLEEYRADPTGFLEAANAGQVIRARIQAIGFEGLQRAVRDDAEKAMTAVNEPNFGRDENVQGFGARKPSS
ncbi:MAG TPA: hypothetical protein VFW71_12500 [Actinomycetota bacterium]|nr:hypothetical protein [Actinomycetota bacterium]